ncbi:MAG TPA: DcaP family trimeric outer membrane transporter [Pyrinomonadaceae bacterium]|nr:DcaP family trimeric outer membrane transporter [Pyrinomonadaceae bacterium]
MKINHFNAWLRIAWFALVAITLLGPSTPSIVAQSQEPQKQTPEVQQLKERLQQLEQTVQELKGQINAMEETKKNPVPQIVQADYAPAAPAPPPPDTVASKPQDAKGESTFEVYGFAMLDAGYQFKQNDPDWFDVVRPTKLPSFPNEFAPNGNTYFSVRQSRLGVKSSTPTKYGELKTQFEFELFGTGAQAGQTIFRLRHAWGELGQFGAGQQNSTFMDGDVFPNTIEYWGPNGMVLFRNVQFRWMPLKGRNAVSIALERPGASADQGRFVDRIELQGVRGHFNLPDLTANVRFTRDWGHFQAAGLLRRIAWIDTNNDQFDLGGSAVGAGLNLTSALKFGENSTGKFAFVFGQGIQNYMNDADVDVGIETNLAAGDPRRPIVGKALPMWSFIAYLDHNWNKRWSSSVGYSMMDVDNSNGQAADAYHRGHYASGNLLYYPWENVLMGGEFIWGRRENFLDGFKSDDFRIQFSFKYNFSKKWSF